MCHSGAGVPDPQAALRGSGQGSDRAGRQRAGADLPGPRLEPRAVEAHEAIRRAEPEISFEVLRDRQDIAGQRPLGRPRGERELRGRRRRFRSSRRQDGRHAETYQDGQEVNAGCQGPYRCAVELATGKGHLSRALCGKSHVLVQLPVYGIDLIARQDRIRPDPCQTL